MSHVLPVQDRVHTVAALHFDHPGYELILKCFVAGKSKMAKLCIEDALKLRRKRNPVGNESVNPYVVAITGASGAAYGWRLIQELCARGLETFVLISEWAGRVLKEELGIALSSGHRQATEDFLNLFSESRRSSLHFEDFRDLSSPLASGSFRVQGMIVAPCSMGTIAAISGGISDNLIERRADIMLKERGRLILVPRETPLSQIHLRNMLTLAQMGADIVPAMPGFYHHPRKVEDLVDFVVGKVLELLEISHDLYRPWQGAVST